MKYLNIESIYGITTQSFKIVKFVFVQNYLFNIFSSNIKVLIIHNELYIDIYDKYNNTILNQNPNKN